MTAVFADDQVFHPGKGCGKLFAFFRVEHIERGGKGAGVGGVGGHDGSAYDFPNRKSGAGIDDMRVPLALD